MKKNWPQIYSFTHGREKGISNSPKDPGGFTVDGITLRTYRAYFPRATAGDLRFLSEAQKSQFFYQHVWLPAGCDALESGVDLYAFELAVNNGPGGERKLMGATAHLKGAARIHALDRARIGFWKHLVREWPVFKDGWCARENACLKLALQLAA